jgi:hypothetical protein
MKALITFVIAYTLYAGFQLAVQAIEIIPHLTTMH